MNKKEIKEKLKSSEYDFLRTDKKLKNNIVLLVVAGSHGYGLNTEESDLDIRGISMGTLGSILGLESFDVFEDKKTDTVIYSMKRFVELAMKGAPNVLEILFSNPENILYCDEKIGKMLLDNRDMLMLIRNGSMRHGNKFTEEFYERVRDFEKILKGEICCD